MFDTARFWNTPPTDCVTPHLSSKFRTRHLCAVQFLGTKGEVAVDQAYRGYSLSTDEAGFSSPNPLFMKYTPAPDGSFAGQGGYGYQSIAAFIKAAESVNAGATSSSDWDGSLATAFSTVAVTAVLEAGRRSLDSGGGRIRIDYGLQAGVVVLSEE